MLGISKEIKEIVNEDGHVDGLDRIRQFPVQRPTSTFVAKSDEDGAFRTMLDRCLRYNFRRAGAKGSCLAPAAVRYTKIE
jgi:hypothetical protein